MTKQCYRRTPTFLLALLSVLLFTAPSAAQESVEDFLRAVVADSRLGFTTVIEDYRPENAPFLRLQTLEGYKREDGTGATYDIEYVIAPADVPAYLRAMATVLRDWEATDRLGPGPNPSMQYRKLSDDGKERIVRLTKNTAGQNATLYLHHDCGTCTQPGPSRSFLRNRLAQERGHAEFKRLLRAAENGFTDIIVAGSQKGNTYQTVPSALNPGLNDKEAIVVIEEDGERRLQLRPQEEYGGPEFAFYLLEHWDYGYGKYLKGDDWSTDPDEAYYAATRQLPGGGFVTVRRRIDPTTDNDYLEIVSSNLLPVTARELEVQAETAEREADKRTMTGLLGCQSGNCTDGFGTAYYVDSSGLLPAVYAYEGQFENGRYHGLGRTILLGAADVILEQARIAPSAAQRVVGVVGHFARGQLRTDQAYFHPQPPLLDKFDVLSNVFTGTGIRPRTFPMFRPEDGLNTFTLRVVTEDNGKAREWVEYIVYDDLPSGKPLTIDVPIATAFGKCVSGSCGTAATAEQATVPGTLEIAGLGTFTGSFYRDGTAAEGILTLGTGEGIGVKCSRGIPVELSNVRVPAGSKRLVLAQQKMWLLLQRNMCLAGDCTAGGRGISSHIYDCFGQPKVKKAMGFYEGPHREDLTPTSGAGTYTTYFLPFEYTAATFDDCQQLDGTMLVRNVDNGIEEQIVYKRDIRYTKDGSEPYADFLQREQQAAHRAWLAELEAERQRQVAVRQALRTRERLQREAELARRSRQTRTTHNANVCRYCNGAGYSWADYSYTDCTVTYDFTYSGGKYYQSYEHCTENKEGNYEICSVCGGKGHYR